MVNDDERSRSSDDGIIVGESVIVLPKYPLWPGVAGRLRDEEDAVSESPLKTRLAGDRRTGDPACPGVGGKGLRIFGFVGGGGRTVSTEFTEI